MRKKRMADNNDVLVLSVPCNLYFRKVEGPHGVMSLCEYTGIPRLLNTSRQYRLDLSKALLRLVTTINQSLGKIYP